MATQLVHLASAVMDRKNHLHIKDVVVAVVAGTVEVLVTIDTPAVGADLVLFGLDLMPLLATV
jgi:hypothetical protein